MSLLPSSTLNLITLDLSKYPALRPGVNYLNLAGDSCSDIYVGFSHRGIELKFEIAYELLRLIDGSRTIKTIMDSIMDSTSSELGQNLDSLEVAERTKSSIIEILKLLSNESLIEFRTSPLPKFLSKKELTPVNQVNFFRRMRAEENLYSWHPKVGSQIGAESLIDQRRNFSIMIYGKNRLALSLFALLHASGFTLIKLADRNNSANPESIVQIEPDEVCGLAVRGSDVGLRKTLVLADLARNSQLFPSANVGFPSIPDFIISTQTIPQETMQQWMSEAITHLPISNLIESKIIIGPLVIPGKTPCLNCLNLWRGEQFPHHNSFELLTAIDSGQGNGLELPSAQVALLAGLLTAQIIQYCTSVNPGNYKDSDDAVTKIKLIGATLTIDLLDPIDSISSKTNSLGYRYWQPHDSCGCQQLI